MDKLMQDLRYATRVMIKNPGFSLIAILSLALGIGANTAVFSIVNAVLLRPLPVTSPDELVSLFPVIKEGSFLSVSYPNYVDIRDKNEVFSDVMAYQMTPLAMNINGDNERIWGTLATGNYFRLLGINALQGRTLVPEDDAAPGASPVAVISYNLWNSRFGSDPNIVGQKLTLNNNSFTIVGVAPKGFVGTESIMTTEIWVPMMMQAQAAPGADRLTRRGLGWLRVIGRRKPDVSFEQTQASMSLLASQLEEAYPDVNKGKGLKVFKAGRIHPDFAGPASNYILILMAVVSLVLLIACINLAGLLLARASSRRREIGIRLALGAGRGRLIQQLLTETVLLSLLGGAVGLLLGLWATRALMSVKLPTAFPITFSLGLDTRVLLFTVLLSVVTGVIFGLAPALQATGSDLIVAIKDKSNSVGQSFRRSRLRSALLVGQVALCVVLLITAGLFTRSLQQAQKIDIGFNPNNVLLLSVDLRLNSYNAQKGMQFYRELPQRVQALPGVQSASWAQIVPLGLGDQDASIYVEGYTPPSGVEKVSVDYNIVGKNYFDTMGIPVVQGADFNDQDTSEVPPVLMVNEAMVKRFWPDQDPVGKRVSFQGPQGPYVIVKGVVKDGKYRSIGEAPRPYMYLPLSQNYASSMTLHVRTQTEPKSAAAAIRGQVQSIDGNLPVYDVRPLTEHMSVSMLPAQFGSAALAVFGLIALLLACVGIYGITAFSVAQRTNEIGIRMALGAQASQVLKLVMGQSMILLMIGLVVGLVGAFALGGLIASFLYGISPKDPLTFAGVTLIFIAVTLLACYIPARRAIRVDPVITLKAE